MSTVLQERAGISRDVRAKEVLYALCPKASPSHIAVAKGWTASALAEHGGALVHLRATPDEQKLWPHLGHRSDSLIREGGLNPALWAKADVNDTVLVGTLDAYGPGGRILVRTSSGYASLRDLKGAKFGVAKGLNKSKLDFSRAPSHHGVLTALRLAGLRPEEVTLVDLEHDDHAVEPASKDPEERNSRLKTRRTEAGVDIQALAEGKVDAIFAGGAKALFLERTGRYRAVADINQSPDWTIGAVSTSVITVSRKLADDNPALIVAWLRAALRGARWTHDNRHEAAEIFGRVALHFPATDDLYETIRDLDLTPKFSEQNIVGLEIQKAFLLKHGYIKNDFAIRNWINPIFLEEALSGV